MIVIGNGTASRETEEVVADFIRKNGYAIQYTIVNEAGASVYSASKLAAEEYPDLDVTTRGAMSLGRRLQDPLAELVKIDPRSIGVGQYQHDMNQKLLAGALGNVVEDCVNRVGVDLNTASPSLLSYVAGINGAIAKNIVCLLYTSTLFCSNAGREYNALHFASKVVCQGSSPFGIPNNEKAEYPALSLCLILSLYLFSAPRFAVCV